MRLIEKFAACRTPAEFTPDPSLADWLWATFIDPEGPMANQDHDHLLAAHIGCVWAAIPNRRKMRDIIGEAELGESRPTDPKWKAGRREHQLREWFGEVPDFLITVSAPWAIEASDMEFCALLEHELYHCAQQRDAWGTPKFSRATGRPMYAIQGHDVEEFIGVVARYGMVSKGVERLVDAALKAPAAKTVTRIAAACGVCVRA